MKYKAPSKSGVCEDAQTQTRMLAPPVVLSALAPGHSPHRDRRGVLCIPRPCEASFQCTCHNGLQPPGAREYFQSNSFPTLCFFTKKSKPLCFPESSHHSQPLTSLSKLSGTLALCLLPCSSFSSWLSPEDGLGNSRAHRRGESGERKGPQGGVCNFLGEESGEVGMPDTNFVCVACRVWDHPSVVFWRSIAALCRTSFFSHSIEFSHCDSAS